MFGSILIAQIYRYRHAGSVQRKQIKWVMYGIVVGTAPLLLFFLFYLPFIPPDALVVRAIAFNFWGGMLWGLFVIELALSLTIAIFRSNLLDIDVIIRRTVQYTLLTALLATVFFGSVIVLQELFGRLTGERNSPIVTVISTLAIAAISSPLRRRSQGWIDRRFFRAKYNAEKALAGFSHTARAEVDINKLSAAIVAVALETMHPETASLWIKPNRESRWIVKPTIP